MMLVADRVQKTRELSEELQQRPVQKSDLKTVRELIEEERESHSRSDTIANKPRLNENYRRGQASAAQNSLAVIDLLNQALRAMKQRDATSSARLLLDVAEYRSKKKSSGSGGANRVLELYQQYLAESDERFHAWLTKKGHLEALLTLGVAMNRVKRPVAVDAKSNRPEDY